jgi:hypothetical protein
MLSSETLESTGSFWGTTAAEQASSICGGWS